MSNYLAIDTATDRGSVAVGEPGGIVAEAQLPVRRHARELAAVIPGLMRAAGIGLGELTGIIVGDGPGSFTGLRIGFATALGLIGAHGHIALLTAPSLLGTAWRVRRRAEGPVAALYDALRGQVFAGVYEFTGGRVNTLVAPTLTTVGDLIAGATVVPGIAAGDGAVAHASEIGRWIGRAALGPPEGGPAAAALIELLALEGAVDVLQQPLGVVPVYGRTAEAQVRWEQRHGRPLPDTTVD
jgi:tRNA threonylcarbamoyladenosine biosynthesis protein TsaB